jgi:hypothetical protein
MKRLTLILTLTLSLSLLALALSGCSGSTEVNVNANVNPAATGTPATTAPPAAKPAATTATSAANTGVASCDEYLTQVGNCLNNPRVPEQAKAVWRQTLEQNRTAWKQAASTPQGKAALESSCKMALDGAKSFLATCK